MFSNVNQTGNSNRKSISVSSYFAVNLLRKSAKIISKAIKFFWIKNLLTKVGKSGMNEKSKRN
jgi:hypothetical protein